MVMDKDKTTKWTTLDCYIAGFLYLKNFNPQLILQNTKVVFAFDVCKELVQALEDYNTGAQIGAQKLAQAVKTLRAQIYSLKMNNEEGENKQCPTKKINS
jgi:hypothetical protein